MKKKFIEELYNAEKIAADKSLKPMEKIQKLVRACHIYSERLTELEKMPSQIEEELKNHEAKQRFGYGSNEVERMKRILRNYQDTARNALGGAERFRDEMLVYFRALIINLEMTGNASTHAEKGARLRGAIELLEHTVHKLQQEKFDFSSAYWRWADGFDMFRSDYPVRDLLASNRSLKYELEQAQKRIAKLSGEMVEESVNMVASDNEQPAEF